MKKTLLSLLIVTAIAQLLVPAYMIWDRYDVLRTGEEIKIKVEPFDPYDAFRGRYVSLDMAETLPFDQREGMYGIFKVREDGFAVLDQVTKEKPYGELYLVSEDEHYFYFPLNRYYMEETLAPMAEAKLSEEKEAYVTVRIKGDKSVLSGLYIDGKPAQELLSEINEQEN